MSTNSNRLSYIIIGLVVVAAIALVVYAGTRPAQSPTTSTTPTGDTSGVFDTQGGLVIGNPDAPVTLVEFADFQCVACVAFWATIEPQLRSQYVDTGKAKIVFKPLTFIDSYDHNAVPLESYDSATAALCAAEQGEAALVAMHDAIYGAEAQEYQQGINSENSGNLTDAFFANVIQSGGFDVDLFTSCYNSDKYKKQLGLFMTQAQQAMPQGVSTPTMFVGDQMIKGVAAFSVYKDAIDGLLLQKE